MFATDRAGAAHWAAVMQLAQHGVYVKAAAEAVAPQGLIEEAEVLEDRIAVDIGDRVLFFGRPFAGAVTAADAARRQAALEATAKALQA